MICCISVPGSVKEHSNGNGKHSVFFINITLLCNISWLEGFFQCLSKCISPDLYKIQCLPSIRFFDASWTDCVVHPRPAALNRQFCVQRWIDSVGIAANGWCGGCCCSDRFHRVFRMMWMIGVLDWDELYAVGGVAAAADVNSYRLTNIAIIESVPKPMKMATSYTRMDKFCTANVLVVMLNFPFESRCIILPFVLWSILS